MRKSQLMIAGSIIGLAIAASMPAMAQSQQKDDNAEEQEEASSSKAIIVTGSRIARPTLESNVPITTVDVAELTERGDISLGDALNDLPSLRSTFSSGNSSRFIGTTGLNVLDLRGLGTSRTLVLVNGRRHVSADAGNYLVDVNTIPTDLLERVDVVTGGSSSIYGSDAIAGVVNFVLRRDYDGIAARAQSGISSRGDRATNFVSLTAGKNFADGRGNVAMALEYGRAAPLFFRDRDELTGAYSGRCQFQLTENTVGEPAAGNGTSDTTFLCGINNASISDGGTIGTIDASSSAARRYLRFDSAGNVFLDTPTRGFSAFGSGNQQGGEGSTLRNTGSLAVGVERYSANFLGSFEFSEALRFFSEAKYVRTIATGEGQPSFFSGGPQTRSGPALSCSNGFLTPSALATLQTYGLCTTPTGTIPMSRFNVDFGGRGERQVRETYRVVAGFDGTFNDDWRYEIFGNYGRFENKGRSVNNLLLRDINGNVDGFGLASDAVLAPASFTGTNFELNSQGQRVICRVNAVTNTRPDCVPLNMFGHGSPSQAALDFINTEGERTAFAEQINFGGFVSGDLSQLFELPGGPIGFAFGAEYRSERAGEYYDDLTAAGATFLNALQPFTPPNLNVVDIFGEVRVPLLRDLPFANNLEITAAARMSDYNTATDKVWSYNVGGIYSPVSDIKLRVNYSESVRAPTQSDLYSTASQNFAQIADPCDSANIGGNPNRAANCAAAGVPTTANAAVVAACAGSSFPAVVGQAWQNCLARTSSTGFASGGNPTLVEERGKSWTVGAIFEPSFIPGLNFTVDYYKIDVENLISALGAGQIISLCYDNASGINNPFCATVNRDPATGLFVQPAVISGGINFAAQKTEGIDFDVSYRKSFDNGQSFELRAIATYLLTLDNYTNPQNPLDLNRQKSELGDPSFAANIRASYDFGGFELSWTTRYIGKQTIGSYETQNQYQGICPTTGLTGIGTGTCTAGEVTTLAPQNADAFPQVYYPDAWYHNARIDIDVADKMDFYFGVDNLFDRKPPLGLLGTAGGDPYDSFGRYFYTGLRLEF
ncbi:hypothetical protein LPB140_07580 [Sphingorhabdus lutea]|uniref:TonB-dependent receptor n=1 Tax=Sphingorhabdus lutea TaxID=1913578 RepID=A0A1L3JC84_9SPHN|nr:TonB-dependent receptor [Sphingorhabdus lutea]APG62673.1 hypothetical protein LPB140_07580 [Sphingorhabdus lutea]